METVSVQVLTTMGRWFAIFMLFSLPAYSQENEVYSNDNTIWHNALFLFCICFFVAGFIFMFLVKAREENKQRLRHERRLSHNRRQKPIYGKN